MWQGFVKESKSYMNHPDYWAAHRRRNEWYTLGGWKVWNKASIAALKFWLAFPRAWLRFQWFTLRDWLRFHLFTFGGG